MIFIGLITVLNSQELPVVTSLSTSLTGTVRTASIFGGSTLYIYGTGFSTQYSLNSVYFGDIFCDPKNYASSYTQITCDLASAQGVQLYNQNIFLSVSGGGIFNCNNQAYCQVSFSFWTTPVIYSVVPSSAYSGQTVSFSGIHRIADLGGTREFGEVKEMRIGNYICDRLDFQDQDIDPNLVQNIDCNVNKISQTGYYSASQWLTKGNNGYHPLAVYSDLKSFKSGHVRILPTIQSVSANSGNPTGQLFTIKGSGFSSDPSKITVKVAGVACNVIKSSNMELTCLSGAQPNGGTSGALQAGSLTNQTGKFIKGSGIKVTYLDTSSLSSKNIPSMKTNLASLGIISEDLKFQLGGASPNTNSSSWGFFARGFFFAPNTGIYKFNQNCDDACQFSLSTVANSADPTLLNQIAYQPSYVGQLDPTIIADNQQLTTLNGQASLTAGNYYYFQAYFINSWGNDFYNLQVIAPNSDAKVVNTLPQIQKITISAPSDPEIVTFSVIGAPAITYTISSIERDPSTLAVTYNVSVNLASDASEATFLAAIKNFKHLNFAPTVVRQPIDAAGAVTSGSPAGYLYTIRLQNYRSLTTFPTAKGTGLTFSQFKTTQKHSPPLNGTFQLTVNGSQLLIPDSKGAYTLADIPVQLPTYILQNSINRLLGTRYVKVVQMGNQLDKFALYITYVGITGDFPDSTAGGVVLTGGNGASPPQITVSQFQKGSLAAHFKNINSQFLYSYSNTPQITLKVDQITAVCLTDCSYTVIAQTVSIQTVSLTAATLTFTATNTLTAGLLSAINANFPANLAIQFAGSVCQVPTTGQTLSSFSCNLPTYSDGSPKIQAGDHKPFVHITGLGLLSTSAVSNIAVPLTITLPSGGQVSPYVSLAGLQATGMPLPSSSSVLYMKPASPSFTYCSFSATAYTYTMLQKSLTLGLPNAPNGATTCNLVVSYNGKSATLPITFSTTLPTVTALSLNSASPVLKNDITITGTNFGTDSAVIEVWILSKQGDKVYQLGVISVAATSILAVLGGGKTGQYEIAVFKSGLRGQSMPFSYKIVVSSISPTSGSQAGGTVITITGKNFASTLLSNQVFIGYADQSVSNTLCTIISVDTSAATHTITCSMIEIQSGWANAQPVTVVGRLLQESLCQTGAVCLFTYDSAKTPSVTAPATTTYVSGQTVTLSGDFKATTDPTKVKVLFGQSKTVQAASVSGSSLTFIFPSIKEGSYPIKVYIEPLGYASGNFNLSSKLQLTTTSFSGSTKGAVVTLTGSGLSDTTTVYFSAGMTSTQYCVVTCVTLSYTPTASNTPNYTSSYSSGVITLTKTTVPANFVLNAVNVTLKSTSNSAAVAGNTNNSCTFSVSGSTVALNCPVFTGVWSISARGNLGFANIPDVTVTTPDLSTFTTNFTVGMGGGIVTVDFNTAFKLPGYFPLTVCGRAVQPSQEAGSTLVKVNVPAYADKFTEVATPLVQRIVLKGSGISDTPLTASNSPFDLKTLTSYSSANPSCFVGQDLTNTPDLLATVDQIKFYPYNKWVSAGTFLKNGKFQYSLNNSTWTDITTLTPSAHSGWNSIKITPVQGRYFRFSHDSTSQCRIAQLQFIGKLLSKTSASSLGDVNCPITMNMLDTLTPLPNNNFLTYSLSLTPVVTKFEPYFGSVAGGYPLVITGTGFGSDTASAVVTIDKIPCSVTLVSPTSITCTVGARPNRLSNLGQRGVFIKIGNNFAINDKDGFFYAERWSASGTWGGQAAPREEDSVYVPSNMVLMVDQSTPLLNAVVVQGGIIFSDQRDMQFKARYFIINKGFFKAGSQSKPYQKQLVFTFTGDYYDRQLPIFGNKGLACYMCKFQMHGKPRKQFVLLQSTINAGSSTVVLSEAVDWVVGQSIVVASSSYDHNEAQERVISAVSADKLTLTVSQPFYYKHYSATETYGTEQFPMQVEVALLNRNIKVRGDSFSLQKKHGSHLMMTGPAGKNGLVARIQNTEFTDCGQPRIIGRYCMHFHMTGDASDSYVKGNVVHRSFARVLTIHGTHYLTVERNVGYHVQGHNIFLEDGIETFNVIRYNLMISTYVSNTMLQSDLSPASYWITNPSNTVTNNRAAGGDFYGFWYQIKPNPDGPSANPDICPQGMELGPSRDNVAHSYARFGLRVFILASRLYPCNDTIDMTAADIYSTNPVSESVFQNYVLFKNMEAGFLGQKLGNVRIEGFKTADSNHSGIQYYKTNLTNINSTARNILVVGRSRGNPPPVVPEMRGIIAPRTDGMLFDNIRFYNFPLQTTPLQSCNLCYHMKVWITGGRQTFFKNIAYNNVSGNYIFWELWRREIFHDLDGTLTRPLQQALGLNLPSATIFPYHVHNQLASTCIKDDGKWNQSLICIQSAKARRLMFTNPVDKQVIGIVPMNINRLISSAAPVSANALQFHQDITFKIKKSFDKKFSWAAPFLIGHTYNIHWHTGIDWSHMAIDPSMYLHPDQPAIVLRFNYSGNRQLYDIGILERGELQPFKTQQSSASLNPQTCTMGQYIHDRTNRFLHVCLSGKSKPQTMYLDMNAVICRYLCPSNTNSGPRETFIRKWSNTSQWASGQPVAGSNVTIPYEWNLVLDVDPPILNVLEIRGRLQFDVSRANTLQANIIWVRGDGQLIGGTEKDPFPNKIDIVLHGVINSLYLTLDQNANGNKMLANTGLISLNGPSPDFKSTKLSKIAKKGDTVISVLDSVDWKVGDQIVLGPTYSKTRQHQKKSITAINGKQITVNTPLIYQHYGDANPTVDNIYGVLDMRGAVGHLTRSIKIRGQTSTTWGCRFLTYGMVDGQIPTRGVLSLSGVQIVNCGQYDTDFAGLHIQRVSNTVLSTIKNSVIHDCEGFCVHIDQSTNITMSDNVIHFAKKFLVKVGVVSNFSFFNNLLIGAQKRDNIVLGPGLFDDSACYEQYKGFDYKVKNNTVHHNLCQGADGEGFVFPHVNCDFLDNQLYYENTAGSATVAFMFNRNQQIGSQCQGGSNIKGYASQIGHMAHPAGWHSISYKNMMFAQNERGMTLRFAKTDSNDNFALVDKIWFSAFTRPNCPSCYSASTNEYCRNSHAIRMLAVSVTGKQFPLLDTSNVGFDVICTAQVPDARAYLSNVVFQNYRANSDFCSDNYVFIRHNLASDMTGGHYLVNTTCLNCDPNYFVRADKPNPALRGWFGGCDNDCTGPNNYIIEDQSGLFLGFKGTILANNTMVGEGLANCSQVPLMNSHLCRRTDLAVAQFQSVAPDFNTRTVWMVTMFHNSSWKNLINGWKQWQWDGPQPMNKRHSKFIAVIQLNRSYNISYSSQPPSAALYRIQRKTLNGTSGYYIANIYYPVPNSVRVSVNGKIVTPFRAQQNIDLSTKTDTCGANTYFHLNSTISFMVNGQYNCQVKVQLVNSIQLTTRFSVTVQQFISGDGVSNFIDRVCAFLGIDTNRLKIVNIRQGSAIVDYFIDQKSTNDLTAVKADLVALSEKLADGINNNKISGVDKALSHNSSVIVLNPDGSKFGSDGKSGSTTPGSSSSALNLTLILAITIPVGVAVIGLIGFLIYYKLKLKRDSIVQVQQISQQPSIHSKSNQSRLSPLSPKSNEGKEKISQFDVLQL